MTGYYNAEIKKLSTTLESTETMHSVTTDRLVEEKQSAEKNFASSLENNRKQWAKHVQEVGQLLSTISSLEIENSETHKKVLRLKNYKVKLVKQLRLTEAVHSEAQKASASLISSLQAKTQSLESNLSATKNELISSENLAVELRTKISEVFEKQIDKYQEAIKNLETGVGKLQQRLVTDREHHESLILTQRSEISDLKKVKEDFDSLQIKFKELNQEFLPLKDQLDESCKVNGYLLLKLSGLENEFKLVLSANEHLKQSLQSIENSCSRLADKFCPVCLVSHAELEPAGTALVALTTCGHVMCSECLENQSRVKPVCPMCQANFTTDQRIKLYF
ncbi:hypothetical protein HDE_06492 [Halotydeus destructor]|nr:hypothetical protein HDE_06492 [Halotydeus destructor]